MIFNSRTLLLITISGFIYLGTSCAHIQQTDKKKRIIVIDPGHDFENPGTTGVRFIEEVKYNDELALKVKQQFDYQRDNHWSVILTRSPGQTATLRQRIDFANQQSANLFISIHHDSAQEKYLKQIKSGNKTGWETVNPISGYSLFVSKDNERFDKSYEIAVILGNALRNLGRNPSLHHAEKIAGESRELLDKENGVYRYDTLAVLQKTKMPAVLIEAGLIVDRKDESFLSSPSNQELMAEAITKAVFQYFKIEN